MNINTVLAIIIVLTFILVFCAWVLLAGVSLLSGNFLDFLTIFIPGGIFFGFWGLVAYRLYYSSS